MDTFTLSRYVFFIFIAVCCIYFLLDNKKATIEKFADAKPVAADAKPADAKPADAKLATADAKLATADAKLATADAKLATADAKLANAKPEENILKDEAIPVAIQKIYKSIYGTSPSQPELDFYTDFAKQRNLTEQKLKDIIETSAPTLQKTFYAQKFADTPDEIFGNENEIIAIYSEILGRSPTRRELYDTAKDMKEDAVFNIQKLRQLLIASDEYKRMERTQTNNVFVNLQGNITDRQLVMRVTALFKEVTGKDYLDEETLKFLKRKYIELELNDATMKTFISNYFSGTPFKQPTETFVAPVSSEPALADVKAELVKAREAVSKVKADAANEIAKAKTNKVDIAKTNPRTESDGKIIYNDAKIFNMYGGAPNKSIIESLMSDDVDNTISKIKNECSVVTKEQIMAQRNKSDLADFVNNRNMSHLGTVCERNQGSYALDDNDDMVLNPEFKWSVPQRHPPVCVGGSSEVNPMIDQTALIGTLLSAAKNTQVGSILPEKPPV